MYLGGLALLSYVLTAFNFRFPMSGALLEAGRNLALAVAMLGAYLAMRRGESIVKWYLVGALAPVYFLFVLGFMSLGFLFAMVMVGFYLGQLERPGVKSKSIKFLMIPMMFIGLMSGFTAWMSIRTAFRQVLWFGSEGSVVETIMEGVSNMSIFSIRDFEALDIVNIRLNLPLYIGRMIEHHELNPSLREFGSTLYTIPFAVVPRFLWPDKPTRGGNEFMSTHTGMTFSSETTFGFGSVFEYYVNFGYSGVFIGFLVFGILLSRVDQVAAIHLNAGRFLQFARLFMVGIVAVDPLQRPFFIVSGAAMAWIIVTLLIWVYEQRSVETGRA